jgi:integrase
VRKRHTSSGFASVVKRKNGKKVIIWRWYEMGPDGKSRERWRTLGLASQFKSDAAARQEAERLGLGRPIEEGPRVFRELVDHWLDTECPDTDDDPNERRAFSTRDNYRGYLRKWINPRWGDHTLGQVKAVAVENWLSALKKDDGTTLANGSKKKIRDLMHLVYEHAIRYEWTDRNPITAVRQSGIRQATPIRLNVDELSRLIYRALKQRERVMVLLDFGTGLRRGELSGVRWEDISFEDKILTPKRSIVKQRVGKVKTEASRKSIPLDDVLIEELVSWRRQTPYAQDSDYVFASEKMKGRQPYWMSRIMQHHIKPAAAKAGVAIKGWHSLRHSYTTLLRQNNNDPKVVQGLLRHASYSITMNVYDEAMSEEKRKAHRGVIQQLNRSVTRSAPKSEFVQVVDKVGVPDGI